MNIQVIKTPLGWQAIDLDTYDPMPAMPYGAEDPDDYHNEVGMGDTKQEAIDDLCNQLGLPYSMRAAS